MSADVQPVLDALAGRFSGTDFTVGPLMARDRKEDEQTCIRVAPNQLIDVMRFLYEDDRCRFEQLSDLTCVDYLNFPNARDRFGVTYSLLSVRLGHRLWVKCYTNDPNPEVPSVTDIWWGADWLEREVYDLFGVKFTGHPDLRRIVTWEGFKAHPLRKDYPLQGRGEREDFKVVAREDA